MCHASVSQCECVCVDFRFPVACWNLFNFITFQLLFAAWMEETIIQIHCWLREPTNPPLFSIPFSICPGQLSNQEQKLAFFDTNLECGKLKMPVGRTAGTVPKPRQCICIMCSIYTKCLIKRQRKGLETKNVIPHTETQTRSAADGMAHSLSGQTKVK